MTEYMTAEARAIAIEACRQAIRLRHPYLGAEHLLLALAGCGQPAGAVLRERGVGPGRVEAEIVRLAGGGLFGDLDRKALAAVGVDVDAVRARTEASFGAQALTRAARAIGRQPGRFDLRPRSGAVLDGVFLPHGPGAGQVLLGARRQAEARGLTGPAGVADLALAVVAVDEGLVPPILAALGVAGPALAAAIADRYRSAG
ncbi:MAG: Clp protease N-terminal domain-containing protein [Actinobacteria bacterium]|nr:Clp protease N-terminal domain-containing protein [Actinomycetota bacterium]